MTANSSKLLVLNLLVASFLVAGCSGGNEDPAIGGNQPTAVEIPKGWNLVWSDDFNGDSLDNGKWNIQTGDGSAEGIPGWGNNELQSYARDNVTVENGFLVITAREERRGGRDYTSGRINSDGKLDFTYGRVEASIQAPANQGLWSAFWMLPSESTYGTWAAGGEIDIMEVFSRDPVPFNQAALHYGMAWPLNTYIYQKNEDFDPSSGFHEYALEWDANEIRWFVDGQHYYTVRNSTYWNYYIDSETGAYTEGGASAPFDQPFHLLLNLAVGGSLPGDPVAGSVPAEMRVDYVRVYQCTIDSENGTGCDGFDDFTDPEVVAPLAQSPFTASYDLYIDAAGPLVFPDVEEPLPLAMGVWDAGGALMVSEVEVGERGNVIDMNSAGGGNFNIFAADSSRQGFFGMGSAADGANYAGEIQLDVFIFGSETDQDSGIQVKLDSGFPDLGFVELAVASLPQDEWTTVTVQISDIAHNPGNFGGGPVDLSQVLSLVVVELTSFAHIQVDNIRILCAHVQENECGIMPPAPPPPPTNEPLNVYIDSVDPVWDRGIGASDSGTGWSDYFDGMSSNKIQWQEVDSDDPERGKVIEVSFAGNSDIGVWFIQASMGVDLTNYASGVLSFDIKVDDYGAIESGMTMKVDCFFPCTSGDQAIGKVGDGQWETVEIPVTQLLGGGLNPGSVNTGIVVFPTISEQANPLTFSIDNVQWISGEPPTMPPDGMMAERHDVYGNGLEEGWTFFDCCGGATLIDVEDDEAHATVVEVSFSDAPTVAGFENVAGVDLSALAEGGRLQFDFKEVNPPPEGAVWLLKVESLGAATATEVQLTAAENPAPSPEWQTYSYTLSGDLAGLDISAMRLVMIFPNWGMASGAVARIDNVSFIPPKVEVESTYMFDDMLAEGWLLWDCCGGATFAEVADDDDHGQVIELTFGAAPTVTGINASQAVDASAFAGGSLQFDFKEVSPPPEGSLWRLKLESDAATTAIEVLFTDSGNPPPRDQWQSYVFDFENDLAGLDLSALKLVMWFPDWGNANGAIARIDNVRLVPAN